MKKIVAGLFVFIVMLVSFNAVEACSKKCDCGCNKGHECTCVKDEKGNCIRPEIVNLLGFDKKEKPCTCNKKCKKHCKCACHKTSECAKSKETCTKNCANKVKGCELSEIESSCKNSTETKKKRYIFRFWKNKTTQDCAE